MTTYRTVTIPADGTFQTCKLIEGGLPDGRTTGLCRDLEEAQIRAQALMSNTPMTEAPHGQCNTVEFIVGLAWIRTHHDHFRGIVGGLALEAYEAAAREGIHSVAWAMASRYAVAGYVPVS